ncbi:MAG: LamG-like jellyroll fold domain-containing protein [Candidatus Electryonea clarkiae]|nr:LamG-like jellyroll fold domain-containing protein [Candidatus Electryonea clarkiae]MDP8285347.1 LamG-like jellyroll fold domain-containing protein [Candidatus Electryonea clarkiae]
MEQGGNFSQVSAMDGGGTMFLTQFTSNRNIAYADVDGWHVATTNNFNEWVEIAIEFDIGNENFDLYVNGVLRAEDRGFNGFPLRATTSMFEFFMWDNNQVPGAYVDDLRIIDLEE